MILTGEDPDDLQVAGVERAFGVAPADGHGVAFFKSGRPGHALANEPGQVVVGRPEEGRGNVQEGLGRIEALEQDRLDLALGVERPLDEENGRGLPGADRGLQRLRHGRVGVDDGEGIVGIVAVDPVLSAAVLGVGLRPRGFPVQSVVEPLDADDDDEGHGQNDGVEPGLGPGPDHVTDGQLGDDHGLLLDPAGRFVGGYPAVDQGDLAAQVPDDFLIFRAHLFAVRRLIECPIDLVVTGVRHAHHAFGNFLRLGA